MISDFQNIPTMPHGLGQARQIAYVVDDIDTAIQSWQEEHGVGPFLLTRNAKPLQNAYYRGQPAEECRINIAFAYVGDMQLELIELIGNTPGLYKEALDRQRYGVHHYAVCVEDFPSAYRQLLDSGFVAVIDAGIDGLARMSYMENPESGLILEIIEWNALTRPYFEGIERMVKAVPDDQAIQEFKLADITPKLAALLQLAKFSIKKLLGRVQTTRQAGGNSGAA